MLGREGVTGIDRLCNLGARKGDRGRARNFGVLRLVPESKCLRGRRGRKTGRKDREGGRLKKSFEVKLGGNMLLKRGEKKNPDQRGKCFQVFTSILPTSSSQAPSERVSFRTDLRD